MCTAIDNLELTGRETERGSWSDPSGSPASRQYLHASTRYPTTRTSTTRQVPAALPPPDTVSDFSYNTFSLL